MSQPTPVNLTLVPQNELTKIVPFTCRVNNIEEEKEVGIEKSVNNGANLNESNNEGINWGNESVKSISHNQEEVKSYKFNVKSNNVDNSKNTENIHDMIKEWEEEFQSNSENNQNLDEEDDKINSEVNYIGERSEARRLGNSSAYDDLKSRFVEDEEPEIVSENNDNKVMKRLKSNQSSQKPLTINKRPDSVGHNELIDELDNLINL